MINLINDLILVIYKTVGIDLNNMFANVPNKKNLELLCNIA